MSRPAPFLVKDCALIALATGQSASQLEDLRDELATVDVSSIYHHFWGGLLEARFDEREYNNDFAAWARHGLHDAVLAERLAVLDPGRYHDIEELRWALNRTCRGSPRRSKSPGMGTLEHPVRARLLAHRRI